jgi:hypothetical protein
MKAPVSAEAALRIAGSIYILVSTKTCLVASRYCMIGTKLGFTPGKPSLRVAGIALSRALADMASGYERNAVKEPAAGKQIESQC